MSTRASALRILRDRVEAGRLLADRLLRLRSERPVVLALPRGGVPVGYEIAQRLGAPLDVLIVRKIGAPDNPEYGVGAVPEDGPPYLDEPRIAAAGYRLSDLDETVKRETEEVRRRARLYRGGRPLVDVTGRTVILVDDGVATGVTLRAAIRSIRTHRPRRVVVALGVAPPDTLVRLREEADEVVVLLTPEIFFAVGEWYREFDQVSDEEVRRLLRPGPSAADGVPTTAERASGQVGKSAPGVGG